MHLIEACHGRFQSRVELVMKGAWMKCYSPEFNAKPCLWESRRVALTSLRVSRSGTRGLKTAFLEALRIQISLSSCGRSARRCSQQYEYERAALQAAKYEGTSTSSRKSRWMKSHLHQNFKAPEAADSQYIRSCLAYTMTL